MAEEITTETIYDGSKQCPDCGNFMTPVEVMYMTGKICPTCRNTRFGKHVRGAMTP